MTRVLLYELCEAHIVSAHFTEPVEDTGFTGVEERKVLGHLWSATLDSHYTDIPPLT